MDARAIGEEQVVDGAGRSNLEELTDWTLWANKVVAFLRHAPSARKKLRAG